MFPDQITCCATLYCGCVAYVHMTADTTVHRYVSSLDLPVMTIMKFDAVFRPHRVACTVALYTKVTKGDRVYSGTMKLVLSLQYTLQEVCSTLYKQEVFPCSNKT